jgi:hypothetical protein
MAGSFAIRQSKTILARSCARTRRFLILLSPDFFEMLGAMEAEEIKQLTEHAENLVREAARDESEKEARQKLIGAIQSLTKCIELIAAELTRAK